MYTCIWLHCCIYTHKWHPHTHRHPGALYSDSTGPHKQPHTDTPTARLNVVRSQTTRWGVIQGWGRLLLLSSPPSLYCHRIDSQSAYVSDLISCLVDKCLGCAGPDADLDCPIVSIISDEIKVWTVPTVVLVILGFRESSWVKLKNVCGLVCDIMSPMQSVFINNMVTNCGSVHMNVV